MISFQAARQSSGNIANKRPNQTLKDQNTVTKVDAYYFVNQSEQAGSSLKNKYLLATVFESLYKKLSPHDLNLTFIIKTVELLILQGLHEEALNFVQLGIQKFSKTPKLKILYEKLQHYKECSDSFGLSFHENQQKRPLTDCVKWTKALQTELSEFLHKFTERESDSDRVFTSGCYFQFKKFDARFKRHNAQLNLYTEKETGLLTESVKKLHRLKDRAQRQLEMNLILHLFQLSLQQINQEMSILRPLMKYGVELDDELETLLEISELFQDELKSSALPHDRPEIKEFEVLKQSILIFIEKDYEAN